MAGENQPINRAMLVAELHEMAAEMNRLMGLAFDSGMVVNLTATAQVVAGRPDLRPHFKLNVRDPKN